MRTIYKMNSFDVEEREAIKNVFNKTVTMKNIADYLPENVHEFLKKKEKLKTISDQLVIRQKNKYRPYDSLQMTKFLTPDFNFYSFFEELLNLSGTLIIFVDAHFLIQCPSEENSDEIVLKFQRGSKASSFNEVFKISTDDNVMEFLDQFKDLQPYDILNMCFENHVDFFQYQGSGLRPYALLGLLIHVQKLPI
jgi:hypothetical protein